MSTESDKQVVRAYFEAFSENRFDDALAQTSDDFQLLGRGKRVNNHVMDKAQCRAAFEAMGRVIASRFPLTIHSMTAEDGRVAVQATSKVPMKDGPDYENNYIFLCTLRDGKIATMEEYACTHTVVTDMNSRRGGPVEQAAELAATAG